MKLAGCGCGHHVLTEHQVRDIGLGNDHALMTGESRCFADIEKSFDLLVDPANRLNPAQLVDRSGDCERLQGRQVGQGRQQCAKFGQRRAVAFYFGIRLLEHQAGGQ